MKKSKDQGFKSHIKACEAVADKRKDFSLFREDMDTYHFLLGNKDPDADSLIQAGDINPVALGKYLKIEKPHLGYGDDPTIPYRAIDFCDSHHMMMSCLIASEKTDFQKIVEIGAGYGNMIRLNQRVLDYNEWIDIDVPFVLELAEWYLKQTVKPECFGKLKFISAYDYPEIKADLVIGTHSLSELAMDDFMAYYEKIIKKARYFFYATHLTNCGAEMLKKKLETIAQDFTLVRQIISEGGGVQNNFYERK